MNIHTMPHTDRSPIMFHAYERPLYYNGKDRTYPVGDFKALVRAPNNVGGDPVCLNVVKKSYKVVQNAELFTAVDHGILDALPDYNMNNVQVIDRASYNGRICLREYRFPEISIEGPQDKIAFRVIVQNGFGGSAIKLHAGAIDFFCTNGMILGDYTSEYAKHTSGVQIKRFRESVSRAVDLFWKHRDEWKRLEQLVVVSDDVVQTWLQEKLGERLGDRIFSQYLIEKRVRGNNLWALYGALTYYSSHPEDDRFSIRNTGNDHEAVTLLKRETQVQRLVADESFKQLAGV